MNIFIVYRYIMPVYFDLPEVPYVRTNTQPGQKNSAETDALGRNQSGFSTQVHLRTDHNGRLMTLGLTPGHAAKCVEPLLATGVVNRSGRGRPRLRPQRIGGDKEYASKLVCDLLRRGLRLTRAKQCTRCHTGPFDSARYRQRTQIERTLHRFKRFRRIATRYEPRAVNDQAMWIITAIVPRLRVRSRFPPIGH